MKYSSRELAGSIDGTTEQDRLIKALDRPAGPVGHLDMAEITATLREAADARIIHGLNGTDVPEHLLPYVAVNKAVNTYAEAIRRVRPASTDDVQAVQEARNKRTELLRHHQHREPTVERVLQAVAEDLSAAADKMTARPRAATTAPQTAESGTVGRFVTRVREVRGGCIRVLNN